MSTADHLRQAFQGSSIPNCYAFGPFVLDSLQHELLKEGKPVVLTPKTYDTLLVLVQNSGRMLSKEELMKAVWPDSFVEESNLTQQVSTIRKALGEIPSEPRYIATIPGRGYRFIAKVQSWAGGGSALNSLDSPPATVPADTDRPNGNSASVIDSNPGKYDDVPILGPLRQEGRKTTRGMILRMVAFGLLVVSTLVSIRALYQSRSRAIHAQTHPRSLAILPLQNLKQDPADDFLGFFLADAIITKLDYVSSLTVRPSAAVEPYRNQVIDIQKVATDLHVDTLLTGSFIHDGDKLRITYQLVDSRSDKILGRGTIDLKYEDLLKVQDDVSQQIIKELELNLSAVEAESLKPETPINPLAYEYFLRGVDLHSQHKFPLAIKMLEKSTDIDPNYASAWVYLGASYNSDAAFEFGGREQYRRAQAAYERALAIRPSQLDAHIFLANLLVDRGNVEQAVSLLRDALKTNPNNADVHWELGYAYRFAGMLNESVMECERARQLDPEVKANGSVLNAYLYLGQYDKFLRSLPEVNDSSFLLFYRGFGEYHQKELERASQDFNRAYKMDPSLYAQIGKALSHAIAHRNADAMEILHAAENKITERGVGDPEGMYKIAEAYSILGEKAAALRVLRTSVEGGFFSYPYLASDPLLDTVRKESAFVGILNAARGRHEAFKRKFF